MDRRTKWIAGGALALVVIGGGTGVAIATGAADNDEPLTGSTLDQARAAALEYTGGGTVIESEAGDDGAAYGVEIRLEDGRVVEGQPGRELQRGGRRGRRRRAERRRGSTTTTDPIASGSGPKSVRCREKQGFGGSITQRAARPGTGDRARLGCTNDDGSGSVSAQASGEASRTISQPVFPRASRSPRRANGSISRCRRSPTRPT